MDYPIGTCFLFRDFPPDKLRDALGILSPVTAEMPRGAILAAQGERQTGLTFLLSGEASVFRDREQRVLLKKLTAGDCFGAASLFSESHAYPTEIKAKTAVRILRVTEDDLRSLFLKYPSSAVNYISFLSEKIRFLNRRVNDFSSASAEEKVAKLLLGASCTEIADIPNLRAAAESMNLGRASLYRVLATFSERGWIERKGKTIRILNPEELKGILS